MSGDMSLREITPPPPEIEESQLSDKAVAEAQQGIDRLFDRDYLKNQWVAPSGPTVLGELMDTSFPLRLLLPSDSELLGAWPGPGVDLLIEREERDRKRQSRDLSSRLSDGEGGGHGHSRSASRASIGSRGAMEWRLRSRTIRVVTPRILQTLDGGVRKPSRDVDVPVSVLNVVDVDMNSLDGSDVDEDGEHTQVLMQPLEILQPSTFTKRPQRYSRIPRESSGADTVVPPYGIRDSSRTPEQRVKDLVDDNIM